MKKWLTIFLTVVLLMLLVACGGTEVSEAITEAPEESAEVSEAITEAPEESAEVSEAITETPEESAEVSAEKVDAPYRGIVYGMSFDEVKENEARFGSTYMEEDAGRILYESVVKEETVRIIYTFENGKLVRFRISAATDFGTKNLAQFYSNVSEELNNLYEKVEISGSTYWVNSYQAIEGTINDELSGTFVMFTFQLEKPEGYDSENGSIDEEKFVEPEDTADVFADGICFEKYPWGTTFEEIESIEIKAGMVNGRDYGYYDSDLSEFSKELIITEEMFGSKFAVHYFFDENDRLVSVMPVQGLVLTEAKKTEIFLDAVEYYKGLYGEPVMASNLYNEEAYADLAQYTEKILGGESAECIWFDSSMNQLVVSYYHGNDGLEIVIIFSTADYAI